MTKYVTFFLSLILFSCSCASLKTGKDGLIHVEYQGTAGGASQILAQQNRHLQSVNSGEVAKAAIAKGLPTSLGQDMFRSDVQAGFSYGYGMGMMGYGGIYGNNPTLMAAEAASRGMYAGGLPRLGEAPVYVQPAAAQAVQAAGGTTTGAVPTSVCPTDRDPATHAEEIACLKVDRDTIRKRVYGK